MRIVTLLILAFSILAGCQAPKKIASTNQWIQLFDGKSLEGWRAYNGKALPPGWGVVNGEMTFSTTMILEKDYDYKGSRDIIYGARAFDNFELVVEWKIPPGGNSGIFYHIAEGYRGIPEVAPEYQLIDDEHYTDFHDITSYNKSIGVTVNPHKLQPLQSTGADYAMYPPDASQKATRPAGEWNETRIIFTEKEVQHWLNGKLIVRFIPWSEDWIAKKSSGKWGLSPDYGKFKKGFIGFQDHGSSLWFRNIRIKPL
ncbi:MAG: DUF1080 domain-containing protein [Bacteroidetes bacterium]|nr:DUF1080 domain-containing protein [Bacteroidota bacterium]